MPVSKGKPQLSADLAEIGNDLRLVLAKARDAQARYFDNDISTEVNGLAQADTMVPETAFDKTLMLNTITLLEQFINFMDGEAVAQTAYRITANQAAALHTE